VDGFDRIVVVVDVVVVAVHRFDDIELVVKGIDR